VSATASSRDKSARRLVEWLTPVTRLKLISDFSFQIFSFLVNVS
jgi:hypothetical protein